LCREPSEAPRSNLSCFLFSSPSFDSKSLPLTVRLANPFVLLSPPGSTDPPPGPDQVPNPQQDHLIPVLKSASAFPPGTSSVPPSYLPEVRERVGKVSFFFGTPHVTTMSSFSLKVGRNVGTDSPPTLPIFFRRLPPTCSFFPQPMADGRLRSNMNSGVRDPSSPRPLSFFTRWSLSVALQVIPIDGHFMPPRMPSRSVYFKNTLP